MPSTSFNWRAPGAGQGRGHGLAHALSQPCPSPSTKDLHPDTPRGAGVSHARCLCLTRHQHCVPRSFFFPPRVLKTPFCIRTSRFSLTLTGITGLKCQPVHHGFSPTRAHPWHGAGLPGNPSYFLRHLMSQVTAQEWPRVALSPALTFLGKADNATPVPQLRQSLPTLRGRFLNCTRGRLG